MTSPVTYWHVPDLEAKLAEVTAAGATVKEPAHDVGGKCRVLVSVRPLPSQEVPHPGPVRRTEVFRNG